jgi:hypothetical protein
MPRKMYSCDFETTTKVEDCRVWAYGYMNIEDHSEYKIGNSLDEFMAWVLKVQADLYFHNLKFDGAFIINWLERNGFKWSADGLPNWSSSTCLDSMACNAGIPMPPEARRIIMGKAIQPRVANASKT